MSRKYKVVDETAEAPKALVVVEKTQVVGSPAERIAAARAKQIELSKKQSRAGERSGVHGENFWTDFAGPETSHFDFERVLFMLSLPILAHPKYLGFWCNRTAGTYDRKTGTWKAAYSSKFIPCEVGDTFALADLKKALAERIVELNISEVLLVEWLAAPHADDQAWSRQDFEDRMKTFREQS
jgi:hypothetical protein